MNTGIMDGKLIANVFWPNGDVLTASDDCGLHMSATYHGDHDEFWIVQSDSDGKEVARFNPRYCETFAWVEPIEPPDANIF